MSPKKKPAKKVPPKKPSKIPAKAPPRMINPPKGKPPVRTKKAVKKLPAKRAIKPAKEQIILPFGKDGSTISFTKSSVGTGRSMSRSTPTSSTVPSTEKPRTDAHPSTASKGKGLSASLAKRTAPIPPHVIVEARAGTGKTTTLIEGLKLLKGIPSKLIPSPQQKAVWDAIGLSKDAQSVCFVAFNKSIATELQQRVPQGCDAMTMHSMGYKSVRQAFSGVKVESWRVQNIISELLETDVRQLRREKPMVLKATEELVSLCKMNLVGPEHVLEGDENPSPEEDMHELQELASYYDIDLNGQSTEVFPLVPRVLERCKDVARDQCCDFADMIWLPVVLNLPIFQYDLLLIDEAQDLNRCQQSLAKRAGRRLILCGDPKQAIYGFAGADTESMPRIEEELSATKAGCLHLPLTVTRRCGKAIVKEAQRYVPDFEAFESNPAGSVTAMAFKDDEPLDYRKGAFDGCMILSRVNAPLVSECFKFLKQGRKAMIQGRDIGQGLISTVQKLCKPLEPSAVAVPTFIQVLSDWLFKEQAKEQAKRNPNEARIIGLQDRHDCLMAFCSGAENAQDIVTKIESVFTDDRQGGGIKLSSIHKAKGLEANRVFFLNTKEAPIPHPMSKTAWARKQEMNLLYVGITRAIQDLIWVN